MDVGDWITEPELHAPDRAGPGSESSRRWFDSFSARLRLVRLGCLAAKVGLLRPILLEAKFRNRAANRRFQFYKRRQLFVGADDETLSVAVRVNNPDGSASLPRSGSR